MNDKWRVIPSELARIFISLEIFELGIGFQTAQWFKTEGRGGEMDEIVAPCWICLPLKRLGLSPKSPPKMTYSACYGAWLPWLVAILLALQPFKVKEISVK